MCCLTLDRLLPSAAAFLLPPPPPLPPPARPRQRHPLSLSLSPPGRAGRGSGGRWWPWLMAPGQHSPAPQARSPVGRDKPRAPPGHQQLPSGVTPTWVHHGSPAASPAVASPLSPQDPKHHPHGCLSVPHASLASTSTLT